MYKSENIEAINGNTSEILDNYQYHFDDKLKEAVSELFKSINIARSKHCSE